MSEVPQPGTSLPARGVWIELNFTPEQTQALKGFLCALLWKRICETDAATGSVMVFSASNEEGFEMKVFGDPKRKVIDFEGIQLITVTETSDDATEGDTLL